MALDLLGTGVSGREQAHRGQGRVKRLRRQLGRQQLGDTKV